MDTLDKVQGAHSDWPISMDSLGIVHHLPGECPWTFCTLSMDSLSGKCGHCPLIPWTMSRQTIMMSTESLGSIDIVHRQRPLFVLNEFVKKLNWSRLS